MTTPTPNFEPYDRAALRPLCWGLLLHMNGLIEESTRCFESLQAIESNPESGTELLKRVADSVSSYREAGNPEERSKAHRSVVWALGRVLDPDGHGINPSDKDEPTNPRPDAPGRPRLSAECKRCGAPREAHDSPEAGYSRDPFKRIGTDHMPEIGLAAIAYLMRAHSFFFFRPREERTFNAAKVSLNDLFQVTQLTFRLYYALEECHHKHVGSRNSYIEKVRQGPELIDDPWCSPFFIWTTFHLVEIQRGNIYRQLQYSEEANRYYRQAQERFLRLKVDPFAVGHEVPASQEGRDFSSSHWFITPTLVRTLVERSKELFDRGLFIDSVMCQIHSLALLSWQGRKRASAAERPEVFSEISRGLAFLNVVRNESVWSKDEIHDLFFGTEERQSPFRDLLTDDFLTYFHSLGRSDRSLAADCYARIALTLFILRTRTKLATLPTYRDSRIEEQKLETDRHDSYEDLVKMASLYEALGVKPPSAIVCDALMILAAKFPPSEGNESLDRSLRRNLGDTIRGRTQPSTQPRNKRQFFEAVLKVATEHILNIVTIPRRIQNFLIRPGYKERRKSGDLSGETVAESVGPDPAQKNPDASGQISPSAQSRDKEDQSVADKKEGKLTNKLVVLRRWQSFNPKIPRPHSHAIRGGGYFLIWGGKGVVVDPGYDFLQNFYDEGFSIADIDAVVVTHTHPDHEDDLSTLSTLVREWNEYHQRMGREDPSLSLDLLLNESAHLKFSNWLKASDFGIGRIIPLPLVVWNLDSKDPREELRGGEQNVRLPLRKKYNFDIEVVPAWHDDVIGKTAAVGLKFYLYPKDGDQEKAVGVLGYTSDTGAYPWTEEEQEENRATEGEESGAGEASRKSELRVQDHYKDCDVLVAHLGDVRLRELFSLIDSPAKDPRLGGSIGKFLSSTFCRKGEDHVDRQRATKERIGEFFKLLITLHLAPQKALDAVLDPTAKPRLTVARALSSYIDKNSVPLTGIRSRKDLEKKLDELAGVYELEQIVTSAKEHLRKAIAPNAPVDPTLEDWQVAYTLLGFLCATSASRWHYDYHLGTTGLYRMQRALLDDYEELEADGNPGRERILVVGELPEELASYRHHIARLLNFTEGNFDQKKTDGPNRRVHPFTGDIGLHIGLGTKETESSEEAKKANETQGTAPPKGTKNDEDSRDNGGNLALVPKIRCTYCNYNNETVLKPGNYHPPEKIFETPLKRLDSAMIYLCTEHDHHPEAEWSRPPDFLSRPSLRVI